jgi:hypothetical protein
MDLQKLWENVTGTSRKNARAASFPKERVFLQSLSEMLTNDVRLLTRCAPPDEAFSYSGVRVQSGYFQIEGTFTKADEEVVRPIDYVFVQVPSRPGFLIQYDGEKKSLTLERATKVLPRVVDFTGEDAERTLFVSQLGTLEVLNVLEEDMVRTEAGQTLSVGQFSEKVLTLAFEDIEQSLQEWVRN